MKKILWAAVLAQPLLPFLVWGTPTYRPPAFPRTLVARYDFNNYDSGNPASPSVLVDSVTGVFATPARNATQTTEAVTDGTLGAMYVVAPDYAGGDAEARTCAATLASRNYALAIPKGAHVQIPVPSALVGSPAWTMRIRFWSPAASRKKWRSFFANRENSGDGMYFIDNGNRAGHLGVYSKTVSDSAWHTLVLSVGPSRSDVYIDGVECSAWNANHYPNFFTDNSDRFILCGDNNGEDELLYIDYVELYSDGGAPEARLPAASGPGLVGEWRFSGAGDDWLKATVGYDLEKYTRSGGANYVLSDADGVLPGDGYVRAGQNNGFRCYHNLPRSASYTVVMDVRVKTQAAVGSFHALFQPIVANNTDARYYLCPLNGTQLRMWVSSNKYTDPVANQGEWFRVAFTYANGGYKTLYVNGVKANSRQDDNMAITGDYFYFLVDNDGEDLDVDLSYVAIYDGVMTDAEIAARHSRCTAHDADGKLILDAIPAAHWIAKADGWTAVRGAPPTVAANGLSWTRAQAAPAEATYVMDVTLPAVQTAGAALVANANDIASGVYGTASPYNGSFSTLRGTAGFGDDTVLGDWGYWTYNALGRGASHRVAIVWAKTGAVTYYVDGRQWCQFGQGQANVAAKPTETMRFLGDSGATATMITAYDRALTAEEIAALALTGRPANPKAPPSLGLAADRSEAKSSVDAVTFTITGSSADDELVAYQIDYGDGVVEVTSDWERMGPKVFSHVFGGVGVFTVKAKVFTFSGAVAESTVTVTTTAATKPAAEVVRVAPWQQNVYTNRFAIMFESSAEQPGIELQYGEGYAQSVPMTGFRDNGGNWLYKGAVAIDGHAGETVPYRLGFSGLGLTEDASGISSGTVRLWTDDGADFSCAVWGDNQQGARDGDWDSDRYLYVQRLFEHMVARNVDFGLSTGDMASSGDYPGQIEPLVLRRTNGIFGRNRPYYVAFGNHDTLYPVTRTYFETPAANDPDFAALYAESGRGNSYLYRGNVLFVLCDNSLQDEASTKTWLQNLLATDRARQAKFRVVLHHYPFYGECWGSLSHSLVDICKAGNVDLVLSGHMHGYERIDHNGIRQVTNGGAGYLDHVEHIVNNYGSDTKVGGHKDIPYLWARQKGVSETDVLGGAEPVRMGCIQSYGELAVKGGVLTYSAHGFDANGAYIGVFDTFAITSKTMAVEAPAAPQAVSCADATGFSAFTGAPVTNEKWAEYKAAVGEPFSYPDGAGARPVVNVSRTEIERFLRWLNAAGGEYRLPTVAELGQAFGGELRREVAEWTSDVDPGTGWCRILGSPAKSAEGTWMRAADRPSVATPDCHADYLGFRLATGPAPRPAADPWAGPLAALAAIETPAAVYKWEDGELVDIGGEWAAPAADLAYDVPVIVTGAGAVAFDFGGHALTLNAGLAAPNSLGFRKNGTGALTVKGALLGGVADSATGWGIGSGGELAFENVTYRGGNVSFSSADGVLRLKGANDFSGAGLDISGATTANFVATAEGATLELFRIGQRVRNVAIGAGLAVSLRDEYTLFADNCVVEIAGGAVLDIAGFLPDGNYYGTLRGAGTLRTGYLKNCDNSWLYLAVPNIVMTTGRPFREKGTRSYNYTFVEGESVRMTFERPWTVTPVDALGRSLEITTQKAFTQNPRLILDGAADGTFAPGAVNASVTVEKAGPGTLTVATSQPEPFVVRSGTVRLLDGAALGSEANRLATGATLELAGAGGVVRMNAEGGTVALAPGVARATLANGSRFTGPIALASGVGSLALGYALPQDKPEGIYEVLVGSGLTASQVDLACTPPDGYDATVSVSPAGDVTLIVMPAGKTVSVWTGAGDAADPTDPGNWQDGKVPDENAYVLLQSPVAFTLPATAELPLAGFLTMGTTLELGADCDWRALGGLWMTDLAGLTIDLKGHDLRLAAAGTFSGTLTITDTTTADPGDLHVDVAQGETFDNRGIALAGNLRLVKDGAGVFKANRNFQPYRRGNEVCEGTLACATYPAYWSMGGNGIENSTAATNVVHAGAVFDIARQNYWAYNTFVLDGGTLANLPVCSDRYEFLAQVVLTADSRFLVADNSGVVETIDLGGRILTVDIAANKSFVFGTRKAVNGTIRCGAGGRIDFDTAFESPTLDLDLATPISVTAPISVRNYTSATAADGNGGAADITVLGVFTPQTAFFHGVRLADGATLDLSAQTDVFNVTSSFTGGAKTCSFAPNSTIAVKLGKKTRGRVVAWETRPDATVKFVASGGKSVVLDARDDGLYVLRGLVIEVR